MEALVHNHQKWKQSSCVSVGSILSWGAPEQGKTYVRNSRPHTFAVRGIVGVLFIPSTVLGVLSSTWSTQGVPGRLGLHRETSTQRKTSENKQQQQKPLMSKRSLIQESV